MIPMMMKQKQKQKQKQKTRRKKLPRRIRRQRATLVFFLQALVGRRVVVELRNETELRGRLDEVDERMNARMSTVSVKLVQREAVRVERLYVAGKEIRFVRIPDDVDVAKTLAGFEQRLDRAGSMYRRTKLRM
eukprot:TRINITY_DN65758_c9_g7_i2.p1 TRINITY_DN65758_c9_g7~~TRINITY_DN65758_c9_g7_i2.p1  ORF type:complete len:133 (+),score=61.19 TRINITY_DN65758_c9_g7_i2:128-526(+)